MTEALNEFQDFLAEKNKEGDECSYMEHYISEQLRLVEAEEVLEKYKMSRTADREKFS